MTPMRCHPVQRRSAGGFTLIESVMSVLIIAVMYAAVLNTVGSSRQTQVAVTLNRKGHELAEHLMSEIMQQPYWDPVLQAGMGPSSAEAATGNRSLFNDVDDYNNWTKSPPQYKSGAAIPGFDGWERKVKISWVQAANPQNTQGSESGIKRIEVTTSLNGKVYATLTTLRANID